LYDKGPTFQLCPPPLMQKAAHAYGHSAGQSDDSLAT